MDSHDGCLSDIQTLQSEIIFQDLYDHARCGQRTTIQRSFATVIGHDDQVQLISLGCDKLLGSD